ncbi:MAG: hypothetical protein ACR2QF_08025 [Geminicoccaceae bacterium]
MKALDWLRSLPIANAEMIGPKDFPDRKGWEGRGQLGVFDEHKIDILVCDQRPDRTQQNYGKDWLSDADEVLFRRDKIIMVYYR